MNFVPRRPATVAPSGRVTLPSGSAYDLSSPAIAELQGTLAWLNHLPRTAASFTMRMPIAPASALRSFQRNYNAEQRGNGYRFNPRQIGEDGQWGPDTYNALKNYVAAARRASYGMNVAPPAAAMNPTILPTDGYGAGPGPGAVIPSTPPGALWGTPIPGSTMPLPTSAQKPGGIAPVAQPGSTPAVGGASPQVAAPAPGVAPASTFPIVPVAVVSAGVIALGAALYLRSQRKGRKGGG